MEPRQIHRPKTQLHSRCNSGMNKVSGVLQSCRRYLPLLILGLLPHFAAAQLIDFNQYISASDNDLSRYFQPGSAFTQVRGNGITGGALVPSASQQQGAIYSRSLVLGQYPEDSVSICFKYNAASFTRDPADQAVEIMLTSTAVHNYYVRMHVNGTWIFTATNFGGSGKALDNGGLVDGNWYRLTLRLTYDAMWKTVAGAYLYVHNLGSSGTDVPVFVEEHAGGGFFVQGLARDTTVQLTINGAAHGGSSYLDDLNIGIAPGGRLPTGIALPNRLVAIVPTTISATLALRADLEGPVHYTLLSSTGSMMQAGIFDHTTDLDMRGAAPGFYFIRLVHKGTAGVYRVRKL